MVRFLFSWAISTSSCWTPGVKEYYRKSKSLSNRSIDKRRVGIKISVHNAKYLNALPVAFHIRKFPGHYSSSSPICHCSIEYHPIPPFAFLRRRRRRRVMYNNCAYLQVTGPIKWLFVATCRAEQHNFPWLEISLYYTLCTWQAQRGNKLNKQQHRRFFLASFSMGCIVCIVRCGVGGERKRAGFRSSISIPFVFDIIWDPFLIHLEAVQEIYTSDKTVLLFGITQCTKHNKQTKYARIAASGGDSIETDFNSEISAGGPPDRIPMSI